MRGVPQIEVTFDIDANGIVNVSAKDLGTGKEQKITISSNTNMSKDDIDKAVKDAEQFAAEDKKRREEVDTKNEAENMCYQAEKLVNEGGDKLPQEDKDTLNSKVAATKSAIEGGNMDTIKAAKEDMEKSLHEISAKLYQQANPQGAGPQAGAPDMGNMGGQPAGDVPPTNDGNVYDADFKDVD